MPTLRTAAKRFLVEEEAVTAVEYALMLAAIVLFCFVSIRALSVATVAIWDRNNDELDAAGFTP